MKCKVNAAHKSAKDTTQRQKINLCVSFFVLF